MDFSAADWSAGKARRKAIGKQCRAGGRSGSLSCGYSLEREREKERDTVDYGYCAVRARLNKNVCRGNQAGGKGV